MATKAQVQELKAEVQKLQAELTQYVGVKQANHSRSMIEDCADSEFKREGFAWWKSVARSLEQRLTLPQQKAIFQISEETESWGGFLSHDVSYVNGPSLRDNPDWSRK